MAQYLTWCFHFLRQSPSCKSKSLTWNLCKLILALLSTWDDLLMINKHREFYTDYRADGYKRPEQRDLHRLLSTGIQKSRTKRFAQTIEQTDTKIQHEELCTDYWADGTKNQHKELCTDYWADGLKKPEQRALNRQLSRSIRKIRTKSSTQTLGQTDSKNQNKELYADYWADGYKTTRRKMSGNRHARGVRGEQRAGEG